MARGAQHPDTFQYPEQVEVDDKFPTYHWATCIATAICLVTVRKNRYLKRVSVKNLDKPAKGDMFMLVKIEGTLVDNKAFSLLYITDGVRLFGIKEGDYPIQGIAYTSNSTFVPYHCVSNVDTGDTISSYVRAVIDNKFKTRMKKLFGG
jgi:hypothetical protein